MVMSSGGIPDAVKEYMLNNEMGYFDSITNVYSELQDMSESKRDLFSPILDKFIKGMHFTTKDYFMHKNQFAYNLKTEEDLNSVAYAFKSNSGEKSSLKPRPTRYQKLQQIETNLNSDFRNYLDGSYLLTGAFETFKQLEYDKQNQFQDMVYTVLRSIYQTTKLFWENPQYASDNKYSMALDKVVDIFEPMRNN